MLVRPCGDADDEPHRLFGPPIDFVRELEDRDAGPVDERSILAEAVRDGDAAPEKGVGLRLPLQHAGDVAWVDVAALHQERASRADGVRLVPRADTEADVVGGELDHGCGEHCHGTER